MGFKLTHCVTISGPLAGFLINLFGCRKVAFLGSIVGAAGLVLSSFATTLYHLYVTFGVMAGNLFL